MLGNGLRRPPAELTAMLLTMVIGFALAACVAVAIASLRSSTPDIARVVLSMMGSAMLLAFTLLPIVFGVDDPLDPRRFRLYGVPSGRLARGIAVAALVSVPTLFVSMIGVAQVIVWSKDPGPAAMAVAAAVLTVPMCVLTARISGGLAASFLSSRRARDVAGVGLAVLTAILAAILALMASADWQSQVLPTLRRLTVTAVWTPLGGLWSAPGDVALGRADLAVLRVVIAVAFIGVLWVAWRAIVAMMLDSSERSGRTDSRSSLGWFGRVPATPAGVVAARSLIYWGRDARYRVSLAVLPVVPVVTVLTLMVVGVPTGIIAWLPVPVMCLFLGWLVHNDLANDSTAFWVHVSAHTRGSDDRWGRILPPLLIGIPLVLLGSLGTVMVTGNFSMLAGLIGLSACVLLTGLGVSSVTSAAFPYPTVHPGDSPFTQPQASGGSGAGGAWSQSLSLLVTMLVASPVAVMLSFAAADSRLPFARSAGTIALAGGLVLGLLVLVGGVYAGGFITGRRSPELLAFTLRN